MYIHVLCWWELARFETIHTKHQISGRCNQPSPPPLSPQRRTHVQDPDVPKSTSIHPSIDEEPVANGNGGVALSWSRGGTVDDRTLPLQGRALADLKSEHIIEVPEPDKQNTWTFYMYF